MTRHRSVARSVIAWGLATLAIGAFVLIFLADPSDPSFLIWVPVVALFMGIGAVLWTKVPANPIGPLFLVAGTVLVVGAVLGAYATVGLTQDPPWPASNLARKANDLSFFYAIAIALIGIPLVFPDGRLPSRRFRWVAGFLVVDLVAWTVGVILEKGAFPLVEPVVFISTIVGFFGAAIAVGVRFRRGDPIQRQQVKWLLANGALAAILFPLAFLMPEPDKTPVPALALAVWLAAVLTLLFLPVVIGIAILRYRLYEIDRIVSRTIAYAVVTVMLVAVFGAIVVVLSTILAQFAQGATIAVAASTLAVFAIFQPLLRRVRRTVDRRFNRSRYNAERTATEFSERLRNEVDITTVTADLDATVRDAIRPVALGLWLRKSRT